MMLRTLVTLHAIFQTSFARRILGLRSSERLRIVSLNLFTDDYGQLMGHIFKSSISRTIPLLCRVTS